MKKKLFIIIFICLVGIGFFFYVTFKEEIKSFLSKDKKVATQREKFLIKLDPGFPIYINKEFNFVYQPLPQLGQHKIIMDTPQYDHINRSLKIHFAFPTLKNTSFFMYATTRFDSPTNSKEFVKEFEPIIMKNSFKKLSILSAYRNGYLQRFEKTISNILFRGCMYYNYNFNSGVYCNLSTPHLRHDQIIEILKLLVRPLYIVPAQYIEKLPFNKEQLLFDDNKISRGVTNNAIIYQNRLFDIEIKQSLQWNDVYSFQPYSVFNKNMPEYLLKSYALPKNENEKNTSIISIFASKMENNDTETFYRYLDERIQKISSLNHTLVSPDKETDQMQIGETLKFQTRDGNGTMYMKFFFNNNNFYYISISGPETAAGRNLLLIESIYANNFRFL